MSELIGTVKKLDISKKDNTLHGNEIFPLGIHKVKISADESIKNDTKYMILYAHWHAEFEFFYLSRGSCIYCIDDEKYTMNAGDMIFVPPNTIHWAYYEGELREIVFYAVVFSPKMVSCYSENLINDKYITPITTGEYVVGPLITRSEYRGTLVLDKLLSLMALYDDEPYDREPNKNPQIFFKKNIENPELKVRSKLFDIWDICVQNAVKTKRKKPVNQNKYTIIQKAIEYMHLHYSEKITLYDIASSVYMSREYFSHAFKEYMNIQPFTYLNNFRVKKSIELLENTDYKIIDIACMCGFEHAGYFNRKFKELMKCTPTEYRQKYQSDL